MGLYICLYQIKPRRQKNNNFEFNLLLGVWKYKQTNQKPSVPPRPNKHLMGSTACPTPFLFPTSPSFPLAFPYHDSEEAQRNLLAQVPSPFTVLPSPHLEESDSVGQKAPLPPPWQHKHRGCICLEQPFSMGVIWLSGGHWHIWKGPQTRNNHLHITL